MTLSKNLLSLTEELEPAAKVLLWPQSCIAIHLLNACNFIGIKNESMFRKKNCCTTKISSAPHSSAIVEDRRFMLDPTWPTKSSLVPITRIGTCKDIHSTIVVIKSWASSRYLCGAHKFFRIEIVEGFGPRGTPISAENFFKPLLQVLLRLSVGQIVDQNNTCWLVIFWSVDNLKIWFQHWNFRSWSLE